jgi:hypothetical protein
MTVTVPELAVPRCGNCGELVFDSCAEEQINRAVQEQTQTKERHRPLSNESGPGAGGTTASDPAMLW